MTVKAAIEIAEKEGFDLVEISPNASPPVCKLIDFGKFKYQQKKKAQATKKKQTVILVKEVKFRPITEEHDFNFKVKHIERFLSDGNKAKVSIRFKGREIMHNDFGKDMINKIIAHIKDQAVIEQQPRLEGRNLVMILAPNPAKKQ